MGPDLIWTLVGFILTLMVFSYLFGDNVLFRIATYLFVGVSSGYAAVLLIDQVLVPRLFLPLFSGALPEKILAALGLLLAVLLLAKLSPRLARLGSLPVAYLVGVGAAVVVGGAVTGTLLGQIGGAARDLLPSGGTGRMLEGALVLIGTIGSLAYFQFGAPSRGTQPARRTAWIEGLALVGQVFIGITLGALFAGVYAAALTAFIERWGSLFSVIANLFG